MPKPSPARTHDERFVKDVVEDFASVAERLTTRIDELELRLSALERQREEVPASPLPHSAALVESHPLAQLSSAQSPGALPAIGRLFLGIAGGYLLRAVAESGAVPQVVIVPLAIVYAAGWLVWAARVSDLRFTSAIYAATGSLIFTPLIWETTFRFKVLPHGVSAAVLTACVLMAAALAWKRNLAALFWSATLLPAAATLMLAVATRDPAPFTVALLLMALVTESAGLYGRWRSLRSIMGLLADAGILLLILVYAGQSQIPPEYPPVSRAVLLALASSLFAIYAGVILLSAVVRREAIAVFDIGQVVIAFALAFAMVLRASHGESAPPLGVLCLLLAVACYLAVLFRFDRLSRNYHVFATWGAVLTVLGSFLAFQPMLMMVSLSVLAVAAVFIAVRFAHWSLGLHGAVYAAIAGYCSGLLAYEARALAGSLPESAAWSLWISGLAGVICCAMVWGPKPQGGALTLQTVLRLFFSALVILAAVAGAVMEILWLVGGAASPGAPRLAVIRTAVLFAVILALSFGGKRFKCAELVWLRNAAIACCTLKLLYEDLRHGTAGSIALSLFLYGTIWVLVPRRRRTAGNRQ